jgi:hypothetical protein
MEERRQVHLAAEAMEQRARAWLTAAAQSVDSQLLTDLQNDIKTPGSNTNHHPRKFHSVQSSPTFNSLLFA